MNDRRTQIVIATSLVIGVCVFLEREGVHLPAGQAEMRREGVWFGDLVDRFQIAITRSHGEVLACAVRSYGFDRQLLSQVTRGPVQPKAWRRAILKNR